MYHMKGPKMNNILKRVFALAVGVCAGLLSAEPTVKDGLYDVYLEPTLINYGNVSTLSYEAGARVSLAVFNKMDKSAWFDKISLGLTGSYDQADTSDIDLTVESLYIEAGYALHPFNLQLVRIMPLVRAGIAKIDWTDLGYSDGNGFGFALMPKLTADVAMPFNNHVFAGGGIGYRMLLLDSKYWGSLVADLALGYRF
jgi:hypothetical protein